MNVVVGVLSGFFGSFLVLTMLRLFAKKNNEELELFKLRTQYERRTAEALEAIYVKLDVLEIFNNIKEENK